MKIWVTKHALTKGITVETEAVEILPGVCRCPSLTGGPPHHYHRKDWYYTREAAVARAEAMRASHIKRLQTAIDRLQAKSF